MNGCDSIIRRRLYGKNEVVLACSVGLGTLGGAPTPTTVR